jgi:2-iminobutanoate/2-iminopropanoate deaminase
MLYTSGMIPVVPETGAVIEGGASDQTEQVLKNLKALLESAGSSLDNVVKTTVFIKNMNDFSTINEIYKKYFASDYPARSCVEVARLPKDVLVEIECIAII